MPSGEKWFYPHGSTNKSPVDDGLASVVRTDSETMESSMISLSVSLVHLLKAEHVSGRKLTTTWLPNI